MSFKLLEASRLLAAAAAGFLVSHAAWAALPAGVKQAAVVEGITEYRLDNGLRVLLAPDASKPTTTVNMTYLVGSRHENYGQTGMAHLLEHMLFKGTPTTRNALGEFSRRGLQANGSTSSDRTNYFASFAANPETLEWYLGWQADAMVNSLIAREDLDSEMTVVRNEMESGENNPFRVLMQKMQAAAYQWHNYGKSTIGARSDVENVDVEQLRAFYRQYYQPDNAVLIVAGKFDPDATLQTIARAFGKLPKPDRTLPRLYTEEPVQDGERSVSLRRAGGTPLVAAMYHVPAGASADFAAMDLATQILADTPSGRLYRAMVPNKLAAGVFGFAMDQHDPGLVMFGAQLQPGMPQDKALETLTDTLESIAEQPFTQEELDRARSQWLSAWEQAYSDPENVGVALSEAIAAGDWRLFFLQRDRVRDMTLAQVQQAAETYLLRSNRTQGRYIPTDSPRRAPALAAPDVAEIFKDYKGDPDFRQAEAFDPSPANIDERTERKTLNLPNGPVQMALLPKATRGERVQAEIEIKFADADMLAGQRLVSSATADLLTRGTDKLSRQEIRDRIDALRAEVSLSGGGTTVSASMSAPGENLPALIALVLHVVRDASFPQAEFDEYVRQAVTSVRSAMTEPTALASRALARHGNPWPSQDIRYVPTFEEDLAGIESLTRQAVVDFHRRMYGAGAISFAAVGDFDPAAAEKALADGLAGWRRAPAYTRVSDPFHEIAAKQFDIQTPDKANAFYIASQPLALRDTDPDFAPLYLGNFLLGMSETSRLWNRVREREGLSYNVRSTLSVSAYEPSADWTIYAIFAPENRARLEAAISEELARVVKDGFTEEEVKDGVAALLNYRRLARAQDSVLASTWVDYLDRGRTFAWSADIDRQLQALSADQVNATLRKYLDPKGFSSAVAGDFEKAARQAKPVMPDVPAAAAPAEAGK